MAYAEEYQFQIELEEIRQSHAVAFDARRIKVEAIRLAKEVLTENSRNKPADESGISAEDIISFADKLANYVNS